MRIKEVETATGLTAKAIRLYESKGLLQVSRESENDYRDYTQEDVGRLKTIAVLRELNVSIREIKQWADGERDVLSLLREVHARSKEENRENELRRELTEGILMALEKDPDAQIPELMEEAKLFQEMIGELRSLSEKRYLFFPIWMSVIGFGPIGMTMIRIGTGAEKDQLMLGLILSVLAAGVIAFFWFRYFSAPKESRDRSGCLVLPLGIVLAVVVVFELVIAIVQMQTKLYIPDQKMIYCVRWPAYAIPIMIVAEVFCIFLFGLWRKLTQMKPMKAIGFAGCFLLINGLLLYGAVTSVSVASETGITHYDFFHPQGEIYSYDEIISVETGFGGKQLGLPTRRTGDFYYYITFEDGTVMNWGDSQSDWDEVSWEWMLRLDDRIMDAGATKEGSDEYWQYVEMDDIYVQILRRVIQNQGGE